MADKNKYPDSYISADIKPWITKGDVDWLRAFLFKRLLEMEDDFPQMAFCSCCGTPLTYEFNRYTGKIVLAPCEKCKVIKPMDDEEKAEFLDWVRSL